MDLSSLIDTVLPGKNSLLDRGSKVSRDAVERATSSPGVRPVAYLLRGNEWLGHPLHPVVVAVPIGAWCVSAWYDLRSADSGDPGDERAADGALALGVAGAVASAVTGLVQYVDARGAARRETAVHAGLNNLALGLYVGSLVARKRGRRPLGRKLAFAGLGVVSVSGWLGGDIAFRHGVGMRPQALTSPSRHS